MIFLVLIYLDAGHGGKDSGAIGFGLKEKDLNLEICKRIEAGLKNYENTYVLQSRTTDVFLSLDQRTRKANNANADVLLSVHINAAAAPSARGFETYVYLQTGSGTVAFQNVMHNEIMKAIGKNITDRGKKQKNLHMVRESKMKAVLTENLFISNAADAALLAKSDFLDKVAQGHIIGLEKFLGLKKKETQPPRKPQAEEKLWIVQAGAFSEKKNAEAVAADLRKLGYRPFIKQQ
jgi:N-acetylmuramoyl-L-alanine amidase